MTDTARKPDNMFLQGGLPGVFAKTAIPIIFVFLVNGMFTLVDAWFLGAFVGADALTAVTLMFPLYMMMIALSTLVSNGYSSVVARLFGAEKYGQAGTALSQSLLLSIVVCLVLIGTFLFGGNALAVMLAKGDQALGDMGYTYISILILCSPMMFALGIALDTLRCQGRMQMMAIMSVTSTLLNVLFNYILIVELELGVAGSALGTVAAQVFSLVTILIYSVMTHTKIKPRFAGFKSVGKHWGEFLTLGAPTSLGFLGFALTSALIIYSLQIWSEGDYDATVGAYGLITRLMTFVYLPMLGLSMAMQTIAGNNFGAKQWERTNGTLRIALVVSFIYSVVAQILFYMTKDAIGFVFIEDAAIASELARILPLATASLFLFGPLMMIAKYFQTIGDAQRSVILGLARPFFFGLPVLAALPFVMGELGVWLAGPLAEIMVLILTLIVLNRRAKSNGNRFGIYCAVPA